MSKPPTTAPLPLRHIFTGQLVMSGGYTSAAADFQTEADTPILRDGQGRVLLAGTGLAGALRHRLSLLFPPSTIARVFGTADSASRLSIADAPAAASTPTQVRNRVAIQRDRGAAAPGLLFDRETAGAGTAFTFRIVLEGDDATEKEDVQVLAWIKLLLETGAVTLGGDSRRGSGHLSLKDPALSKCNLSKTVELAGWLAGRMAASVNWPAADAPAAGEPLRLIRLDLSLEFRDGILPSGGRDTGKGESDIECARIKMSDGSERILLAGSGVRGVCRSRVEEILLAQGKRVCDPTKEGGWCSDGRKTLAAVDGKDLCPCCQLFGAIGWRSRLAFSDFIQCKGYGGEMLVDHVALDRIHGGVHGSNKFDEKPVFEAVFEGMVTLENPSREDFEALAWLAQEASDGRLWFGHSTHRGLGQLTGVYVAGLTVLDTRPDPRITPPSLQPEDGAIMKFTRTEGEWESLEAAESLAAIVPWLCPAAPTLEPAAP